MPIITTRVRGVSQLIRCSKTISFTLCSDSGNSKVFLCSEGSCFKRSQQTNKHKTLNVLKGKPEH